MGGSFGFQGGGGSSGTTPTTFGLYAQTENSNVVTNTIVPTSIIGAGVGTLSVPANAFKVGDSFTLGMGGVISCKNNTDFVIQLVTTTGTILASTGTIRLGLTTKRSWRLDVDFTVQELGGAGVGAITTSGEFCYTKDNSINLEGIAFVSLNSNTFDTLIINTLDIQAQWLVASVDSQIQSRLMVLSKTY